MASKGAGLFGIRRGAAMTPVDMLQELRRQLDWRGPSGKSQGHVVLTRMQAEVLAITIAQGMPPVGAMTLQEVQRINARARVAELLCELDAAREVVRDLEVRLAAVEQTAEATPADAVTEK